MSATKKYFEQLEQGQVDTAPTRRVGNQSATARYLDSLNLPKFEVPSKSEVSQPRDEIRPPSGDFFSERDLANIDNIYQSASEFPVTPRSIAESGIDAGKKLLKGPIVAAETAAAMGTGGLAWLGGTVGAARETLGGLLNAREGEYARVPDESPEALARAEEDKAKAVERNLERMQGLRYGLPYSVMEQLTPGPTKAITPQEMEARRQDLRDTIQQRFTYAPRTEGAQQATEVVVYPFEQLHEASKVASKYWLKTMGVEGDPVAESLLTDALEIVAGAGIFAGVGMGARGANRARIARRRKNVPKKVQKYLDTLDEFGEPKSALRRAAKDVRNWIEEQTQRHKDGEQLSQATVDKLMDLHGKYMRNRKDAPVEVGEPTARGAKTSEQLNQEFLDTLDEFGELVEDPDYQRMIASIEESRGTRSVPKRAEGEPLDTPYVPEEPEVVTPRPEGEPVDTPYTPDEVEPQTPPKAAEPDVVETPPKPGNSQEASQQETSFQTEVDRPLTDVAEEMQGRDISVNGRTGTYTISLDENNTYRASAQLEGSEVEIPEAILPKDTKFFDLASTGKFSKNGVKYYYREAAVPDSQISAKSIAQTIAKVNDILGIRKSPGSVVFVDLDPKDGRVSGFRYHGVHHGVSNDVVKLAPVELFKKYDVHSPGQVVLHELGHYIHSAFPKLNSPAFIRATKKTKEYKAFVDEFNKSPGAASYLEGQLFREFFAEVTAEWLRKRKPISRILEPVVRKLAAAWKEIINVFDTTLRGRRAGAVTDVDLSDAKIAVVLDRYAERVRRNRKQTERAKSVPSNRPSQGLKEFWEAEGKDFPEFKNQSHLYNWIIAWRKKQGESGFGGHANVPPEVARQAAQAYRDRIEVFDQVNAMRKAEGQRKLKRPTQITDAELVRVRETEGTPDVETAPRDTGPTPEEATGGRGVQEATPVSDTSDALQPVKGGKVIRRRKGVETVVRDEEPPPKATQVEEPPAPRETNTPLVHEDAEGNIIDRRSKAQRDADADRMMQDDVTYRRARRRQNDADIEGRERLRPMEQRAAERGYLQRVRDLWLAGRERSEIGETIGREFPEVAQEARDFNRSVAEHIDLDEMFNTAQYKKRKRAPESVRQESSGSTAIDDLLAQLKPRDKKAGPNTLRAVVIIDPMLFRELWKGAKQSNVSLDTFLKNSGVDDPAERQHLVKMARQVRRDVEGLMDVSENLDSIPGQTGEIVNAKEVARRQKAGVESPIVYQGTFNMLQKAVNRAMDKSGVVGVAEGFFEELTTGKRVVQKVLGQAGLEIFWHPIHNAMASVTRELKASTKLMRATAKAYNIGKESSRKLAVFSVAERPGGLDRLKVMKVEPVTWDQLSQTEQAFYTATRKRFDDLLERVNWAREKAGLEGLPKDKNYFPFLALAHKVKDPDVLLHQDLMSEFRQASMKPDSHKPSFTFDKGEVGGPVELDFFDVYNRYTHDALWHINMTPLMGVFERLLNQSIDVKLLTDWEGNKTRKKTMPDGTKKELPVTWQLKQSRGGRIKKTMSKYLKRVYGRYTQNVAGADKKAARIMENIAYEMSKNTASYLVSSVSTVINQIPSVVNTIRETNVGPVARAVPMLANRSAWQKAVNESQALYNRVGAFDAHLVDNRRAAGTTKTQQRLASAYNTAQRGGEILSWPIRAAMEAVDSANVMLAYQAGKKLAQDWGLEGQEAIRLAEQVMIDSQGSGTIADVSSIQSGKATKALTTLQTMVISQFNQLTEGMLKHSEYGSLREKAPKGYQSFQQSFTMKNLRYLAAATVAGYVFEERLNMYSVMPNPLMAAKRVVDRGGDAKDMVEELFAEGVEAVPIAGSLKFDTYSMFGAAVPQMAGAVNSVGMVWDLWDAWMDAGYDPATAMVKAVGMSIMEKPEGEVRGEAYFALAGIPVKQYIRVARQYYRGSEEDWQKLIKGYRFDELEARRAQRR